MISEAELDRVLKKCFEMSKEKCIGTSSQDSWRLLIDTCTLAASHRNLPLSQANHLMVQATGTQGIVVPQSYCSIFKLGPAAA